MRKPGIYNDVSYAEYQGWDAARSTTLRLFQKSAQHARASIAQAKKPTRALELGRGLHAAVLERETFEQNWVRGLEIDRRSHKNQDLHAEHEKAHETQEILPPKEYDLCIKLRNAVSNHPTAQQLLNGRGFNEVSLLWNERETGMLCKCRIDRLTVFGGYPLILDLKSARDASAWGFAKAVADYELHFQAAMYLDGADTLNPVARRFVFLAVETAEPFAIAAYELDNEGLELGRSEFLRCLQLFKNATETNVWPGYPEGIQQIKLPPWKYRKESDAGQDL